MKARLARILGSGCGALTAIVILAIVALVLGGN